jgi:uncharacterized protein YdiU (UPF0061 family)
MTVSGETIDYGPCAFMDRFDPATVFSSIDEHGRYAYGNQPRIALWNLARFAETLLDLIDPDQERAVGRATEVLQTFTDRYQAHWAAGARAKLGIADADPDDVTLLGDLLDLLHAGAADWTSWFRSLSGWVRGEGAAVRAGLTDPAAFDAWAPRWDAARNRVPRDPDAVAAAMDAVNPVYVPRNHMVEAALGAATEGDLDPFLRLVAVVSDPFVERPGAAAYAGPAPADFGPYRTFCGT